MIKMLKELYAYRDMLFTMVRRELRGRYKASVLGFLWTFINPLLQLVVYTVVFSIIMKSDIQKYYLFLFVALIPWIFFATSVQGGSSCIIAQKDMVKKIYFPRQILPIAHVTTCFVNMLLSFIIVFLVTGIGVGVNLLALPYLIPTMIIEYILALGLAFLSSAVTVFFRDLEHILGIIVMAWQFLTPVMYSVDQVPAAVKGIFMMNPMTEVVIAYRDILYYKHPPHLNTMLLGLIIGVVFLIAGWIIFDRLQRHFAEEF